MKTTRIRPAFPLADHTKLWLFLLAFCLGFGFVMGQDASVVESTVRKVADHILASTSFRFIDSKTRETYPSLDGLTPSADLKAESKFNKWLYVNGVLISGMINLSSALQDDKYAAYAEKNFRFIFDNLGYFKKLFDAGNNSVEYRPVFRMGSLDDVGAMAAGLADVYTKEPQPGYKAYLERAADYIMNKQFRLNDGTLARKGPHQMTLWLDDTYMSVPFLARMAVITGNSRYFDFAITQIENFHRYLYDTSTGLYFHAYYTEENMQGVARWGRANGWIALAQAALLDYLPDNHPKRTELIRFLQRDIAGFARYQDSSGLWHQILDKPDSYLESSVTAMMVYTVAKAVNKGWIPRKYISIAQQGWQGLCSKILPDGSVKDICIGTSVEDDLHYYYTRPRAIDDTHGLGPVLLAGAEMLKARDKWMDLTKRK
ncbi:MAG TPA: glycoside hydrolase family 88 protein [Sediminibacterium sp.]|nr:glycoside hydrolase family 88 protein [Sediminibacterium sp.]